MSYKITEYFSILPHTEKSKCHSSIPSTLFHCQTSLNNDLLYLCYSNQPNTPHKQVQSPTPQKCYLPKQFYHKRTHYLKSASDKTILNLMMHNKKFNEFLTISSINNNSTEPNTALPKRKYINKTKTIPTIKKELKIEINNTNNKNKLISSTNSNKNLHLTSHKRGLSAEQLECLLTPIKKLNTTNHFNLKLKSSKHMSRNKHNIHSELNTFRKQNTFNTYVKKHLYSTTISSLKSFPSKTLSDHTILPSKPTTYHKRKTSSPNKLIAMLTMFQRNK